MFENIDFLKLSGPQLGLIADTLAEFTRTADGLGYFLARNGFGSAQDSPANLTFPELTFEVATRASARGTLKPMLDRLAALYPESPHLRALSGRLEALSPIVLPGGDPEEALQWMMSNSEFGSPLLLADKLVSTCAKLCLVRAPGRKGTAHGTGFLVGHDLVLTAAHVVSRVIGGRAEPQEINLTFGLVEAVAGFMNVENVAVVKHGVVCSQPHSPSDVGVDTSSSPSDRELDFALLRIARPIGEVRGYIDLLGVQEMADRPKFVTILQHPEGRALAQSLGLTVDPAVPHRLRYQASTLKGSSGGLVLDGELNAVALHHAGDPAGPLQPRFNQGVPLWEIADAVRDCSAMHWG
jgi:hypothetical protein